MVAGLLDGDGALVVSIGSVGEMRMRYLSEIPLTIERGVLCHNIMSHSVDTRPGPYGFRLLPLLAQSRHPNALD
jgi:hypothetical protein